MSTNIFVFFFCNNFSCILLDCWINDHYVKCEKPWWERILIVKPEVNTFGCFDSGYIMLCWRRIWPSTSIEFLRSGDVNFCKATVFPKYSLIARRFRYIPPHTISHVCWWWGGACIPAPSALVPPPTLCMHLGLCTLWIHLTDMPIEQPCNSSSCC